MRLKSKEIKKYRAELLREQKSICPLCETPILPGEDTLDHDHGTGHIRRVLHRSCNHAEGRILSWIKRSRGTDPVSFLQNMAEYWLDDYTRNPIHPTHKSLEEKHIQKLKRKLKTLKTERGKQRVREQIRDLQENL